MDDSLLLNMKVNTIAELAGAVNTPGLDDACDRPNVQNGAVLDLAKLARGRCGGEGRQRV